MSGERSNKLLFWFAARPRRMKINCCFVFSQNNDSDSTQESPPGDGTTPRRSSSTSSPSKKSSKRNQSNGRRRVIRREDIGLPMEFKHITHLGPDSDLSNATQLSIVCSSPF